jgi:hypothetical protein
MLRRLGGAGGCWLREGCCARDCWRGRLRSWVGWWWSAGSGGGYAGICAGCLRGIRLGCLWSYALGFAWSDGFVDVDWDWRHRWMYARLVDARRALCVEVSRESTTCQGLEEMR